MSERLRPRRLDEVIGNPRARADLRAWAEGWQAPRPPARRAALLAGPPGVGKTSAALALASELGWSVVEMNASDARNADAIERVAGRAAGLRSFGADGAMDERSRTLILLDEADCLTGRLGPEARRSVPGPIGWPDFLHDRYGTVDALNAAWGLGAPKAPPAFEAWADVPRVPIRQRWTTLRGAQRDLAEWRRAAEKPRDLTDRGGLGAIARLVKETRQPLVLTVNDESTLVRYSVVFRTAVTRIRFRPIDDSEVRSQVVRVARREGLLVDARAVEAIVARAHGDFRGALNDLDAVAPLPPGPAQVSVLGFRDRAADLAALTAEALSHPRFYRNVEVRDRTDATPDDLEPWIEENFARMAPDRAHLWAAARRLARANVLLGRARRYRVYGLWSSASELMTGGVGSALHDNPVPPREPAFPEFLGEMGRSRNSRQLREAVLAKLAGAGHLSKKKLREGELSFYEALVRAVEAPGPEALAARNAAREVVSGLELTEEEAGYLAGVETGATLLERLFSPLETEVRAPPRRSADADRTPTRARGQRSLGEFEERS